MCHGEAKYSQSSELLICDVVSVGNCLQTYVSSYLRSFESSSTLLLERQMSLTIFYFNVVLLLSSLGYSISADNLLTSPIVLLSSFPKYSFSNCAHIRFSLLKVCVCVCLCVGGPCVCIILYFMASIFHPVRLFIPYPLFGEIKRYVLCPYTCPAYMQAI